MMRRVVLVLLTALTGLVEIDPAFAQIVRPVTELEGVGVDEHLDQRLPADLKFTDDRGRPVRLGQIFDGVQPVILSLNYTNCPMLCGLKLRGMVAALAEMSLDAGRDFRVVSVSIDPLESPVQARLAKQNYLREYGRGNGDGWTFLTGQDSQIRALASAVGFQYRYVPERREYAHAAVFMICTPDGRVSRYLYGVRFEPKTVELSLVEASRGQIGSTLDRVLLFCFHYDAATGNYAPAAINLMKAGGAVTVLAVLMSLLPWRRFLPIRPSATPVSESLT